jgi:hypothetical protein
MAESEAGPPAGVAERLKQLAAIFVAERDAEARARLQREADALTEPFAVAVARRLEELRALSELSDYLHRGQQKR